MHPSKKRPWHDRVWGLGWLRRILRGAVFALVRRIACSEEGRDILVSALQELSPPRPPVWERFSVAEQGPYADVGTPQSYPLAQGAGTIFITGRFRSGSTLLWNLFRNMKGFTSYYEPHNERRWFDPSTRGDYIDPTHQHISNYWAEYEGLTELAQYYNEDWVYHNLFMDEHFWDPVLVRYTRVLIEKAAGRAVLQCNRIDFRLPWIRRHFPLAHLIHLYRHPRDQWCSALGEVSCFSPAGSIEEFRPHDRFYLLLWCKDLKHQFPFLAEETAGHPYRLFYYLWKLSYLFGRHHAHYSLSLEDLIGDPWRQLLKLFEVLDIDAESQDRDKLLSLIAKPRFGKWKEYAEDQWFRDHETACEGVLEDFFGLGARKQVGEVSGWRASSEYTSAPWAGMTRPGQNQLECLSVPIRVMREGSTRKGS